MKRATEIKALAEKDPDENHRVELLKIANYWLNLATEAEAQISWPTQEDAGARGPKS